MAVFAFTKGAFLHGEDVTCYVDLMPGETLVDELHGTQFDVFWNHYPENVFSKGTGPSEQKQEALYDRYYFRWKKLGDYSQLQDGMFIAVCGEYRWESSVELKNGTLEIKEPFFVADPNLVFVKKTAGWLCELSFTALNYVPGVTLTLRKGIGYGLTRITTVFDHFVNDPPDQENCSERATLKNTLETYSSTLSERFGVEAFEHPLVVGLFSLSDHMQRLLDTLERQQGAREKGETVDRQMQADTFKAYARIAATEATDLCDMLEKYDDKLHEVSIDTSAGLQERDMIINEAAQIFNINVETLEKWRSAPLESVSPRYVILVLRQRLQELSNTLNMLSERWTNTADLFRGFEEPPAIRRAGHG